MSRRRKIGVETTSHVRFRIICTREHDAPVVVETYRVARDAQLRERQLEDSASPDSFEQLHVLRHDDLEHGVSFQQGSRVRSKPEWKCPVCGLNPRITAGQADVLAHELVIRGESQVDLVALARTL